ncbi:SHOCT domain-containing protein [Halorarum halophilum]|uniref:SHOCT domain-containing protein n=1 Tax=Halorarum halophilum TaxID=2743090 RepID=A0A7D5K833_9EURY|nr:SHOCT domain-containing protein [Halobaculum halophilum]QLG27979.1 SHOCT domain-containing protein [Halobaculum halophilum]
MGWLRTNLLWISLVGLLVSGGLLLVVVGFLGLVVYSALGTGTPIVGELLDVAAPVLAVTSVLLVATVLSGVGFVWALLRRASVPRSSRLAALADRIEREYPPLRPFGLSDALAPPKPSAEEQSANALAELKRQYVDGELSEREFERKVDRLVANESVDEARAERERRAVLDDRS